MYYNIEDATAVKITNVSEGNEFLVCLNNILAGDLAVEYDRGDGTFVPFGSGTLTADGETVFVHPGTEIRLNGSEASPDLHVLVQELKFEQ